MIIQRKIRRVGNSLMAPLPPETIKEAGFTEGMEVQILSRHGHVEMTPVETPATDLVEFAARFTKQYRQALQVLAES
ncbi:MAG: hypothetical protein ACREN8_03215 [Candidatus Dormibacteraceae bacterium]